MGAPAILQRACGAACLALALGQASVGFERMTGSPNLRSLPGDQAGLRLAHIVAPRDSAISIALGLDLEQQNQVEQAEAAFLDAVRWDHQYVPAWSLANFYFRHGSGPRFWLWASRAALLCPDDLAPLLELALRVDQDAESVARRLGGEPRLLRTLLDHLIGESHWEEGQDIANWLEMNGDPADAARLLDWKQRLEAKNNK